MTSTLGQTSLLNSPPTDAERRLAMVFLVVSGLVFFGLAGNAKIQLAAWPPFTAIYQTALHVNDLVTAILLLGMYAIHRHRGLLALGCGYLFTGLLVVIHMLTFPGLFSAGGWLGADMQTTAWLFMFWHAGLPIAVLAYVRLRADDRAGRADRATSLLPLAVGAVLVLVVLLTVLAIHGGGWLPAIMDGHRYTAALPWVVGAICLLSLAALIALLPVYRRSKLDLWLGVAMAAWLFDIALAALLNSGRFDLGFYSGRIYGLLASLFVLGALLYNMLKLQAAHEAAQREIDRQRDEIADLYHHAPCGYHALDATGRIIAINDKELEMLGYRRDEVVGKMNFRDLLTPDSRAVFEYNFPIFAQCGEVRDLHFDLVGKDGSVLPVLVSGNLVRGANGEFLHTRSVVVDNQAGKEAEQAVQAAHDALERKVAERTRQLRQLASESTLAEERERRALARDLHDDLGQLLHVAKLKLGQLDRQVPEASGRDLLAQLNQLISDAGARVRSLTAQLCPPVLERLGLKAALDWLAEEMEGTYGLTVEVANDGAPECLSAPQAAIVFRIVRELLINVAKHAHSPLALIETQGEGEFFVVRVSDAGTGIADVEGALCGKVGFGLASAQERMGFLNGSLNIEKSPQGGTMVILRMPFERAATLTGVAA